MLVRKDEKVKCTRCNGTGLIPTRGPITNALDHCPNCHGEGVVNSLEYVEYLEINDNKVEEPKDKVFEWLESNMNKDGLFNFEYSLVNNNHIYCFYKDSSCIFATFFRNEIEKLVEE